MTRGGPIVADRLKILVTSVGSLVGQNILDVLECRREAVTVVGLDAGPENPRLFRCDTAYLTPPIDDSAALRDRLLKILQAEAPDLLLTGRDHDAFEVSTLLSGHPELKAVFPSGPPAMSLMMQDKWASWEFARDRGLAFAETVLGGEPTACDSALDLARRAGRPLLAKPRMGYGSLGVSLLFTETVIRKAATSPHHVIQAFIGPPDDWSEFVREPGAGVPLFTTYRDPGQYSCQAVIGPDGDPTAPFCTLTTMVNGRSERSEVFADPDLHAVAAGFADAVAREGWRGPFNLQCRRAGDGGFVGIEMNGRLTGSTSARAWLGHDEVGLLVDRFVGPDRLPPHPVQSNAVIVRSPTSYPLDRSAVHHLVEHRQWPGR